MRSQRSTFLQNDQPCSLGKLLNVADNVSNHSQTEAPPNYAPLRYKKGLNPARNDLAFLRKPL